MAEEKGESACSPRRKIQEARRIDEAASKKIDGNAEAKDYCDFKEDSKDDAKMETASSKDDRRTSIAEFSFGFIRGIISSTPPTR